jgi:hypothetical protein
MNIKLPTGETAILPGATKEEAAKHEAFLQARLDFALAYAAGKGWNVTDVGNLTIPQILEIRAQPGWQRPEGLEPMRLTGTFVPKRDSGFES